MNGRNEENFLRGSSFLFLPEILCQKFLNSLPEILEG
jgi:hypothetical protein